MARRACCPPSPGQCRRSTTSTRRDTFDVDETVAGADPASYDALVLPGGVANPDALRTDEGAVELRAGLRRLGQAGRRDLPRPWTLIEADVVKGRTLTSWPSLQTDIRNAGGTWVDEEVVVDGNLVTSRNPDDLPAFNAKLVELSARAAGVHLARGPLAGAHGAVHVARPVRRGLRAGPVDPAGTAPGSSSRTP